MISGFHRPVPQSLVIGTIGDLPQTLHGTTIYASIETPMAHPWPFLGRPGSPMGRVWLLF